MVKRSSNHHWGGFWTDKKIDALRKYLNAYTTALKRQSFRLIYIDGFSGTGYRNLPDNDMKLFQGIVDKKIKEGSPFVALKTAPPFEQFIFIEKDKKALDELRTTLDLNFPKSKSKIKFMHKDVNDYIRDDLEKYWARKRAVMFLDPFSIQVNYESIKIIAKTEAIDLWILFPLMAANRLLKNDRNILPSWREKLNALFGDNEWETKIYKTKKQGSLLTLDSDNVEKGNYEVIVDFFVENLKKDFGSKGVAKPKILYSNKNTPMFALCFASGNPKGQPIAVNIANGILQNI